MDALTTILDDLDDRVLRSKLLAYTARQIKGKEKRARLMALALDQAGMLEGLERTEVARYIADCSGNVEELSMVSGFADDLKDVSEKARIKLRIASRLDEIGDKEAALDIFRSIGKMVKEIESERERVALRLNLARGFERSGEEEVAKREISVALGESNDEWRIDRRLREEARRMNVFGIEAERRSDEPPPVKGGKAIIILYNTYEGGMKSIHRRMLARAAPLCWSFGYDLVLTGFPIADLTDLVESTFGDTRIGKGGVYVRKLSETGRIQIRERFGKEDEADWNQLGLPIATTSKPDIEKSVSMREAVELADRSHPLKRVCIMIGMGKKGLPVSLLRSANHHLELTGAGIPLETSVALGVIAERLRSSLFDTRC
jgi:hypothetical protein